MIDETLRFEPTGHATARYVTQDVEYYGTTIPAGSADPAARWRRPTATPAATTDPDVFDIHRDDIQHLTFGYGLHFCLGANLARLEGRVALDELLNRFPEWDVDYDGMQARADLDRARLGAHAARHPLIHWPIGRASKGTTMTSTQAQEPVVVVSNDTHIGPRLVEDLRGLLPVGAPRRVRPVRRRRRQPSRRPRRSDARGQRLPRPPEPPHRRPPRLRRPGSRTTTTTASPPA